jgi:hypothetical protein
LSIHISFSTSLDRRFRAGSCAGGVLQASVIGRIDRSKEFTHMPAKRFAALGLSFAALATTAAPVMAASTPHWSASKCSSYAAKYKKSAKSRKAAANKSLKAHGCKVTVK